MTVWILTAALFLLSAAASKPLYRSCRLWLSLSALIGVVSAAVPALPELLEERGGSEPLVAAISRLQASVLHGELGTAFLLTVMLIGAVPGGSRLRRALQRLRSPLSVALGWLILPHMVTRLLRFAPSFGHNFGLSALFLSGLVCLFLTLPLWITSFMSVRTRMKQRRWKQLQKAAYPLYALVFFHGICFHALLLRQLLPAAVYALVGLSYLVLRGWQHHQKQRSSS